MQFHVAMCLAFVAFPSDPFDAIFRIDIDRFSLDGPYWERYRNLLTVTAAEGSTRVKSFVVNLTLTIALALLAR